MPRLTNHPKEKSFNLRIDPNLKAAFQAATEAEDKPAAQVLRDFMRVYVAKGRERAIAAEARRQSRLIAAGADEAEVLAWIEDVTDTSGWTA